MAVTRFYAYSKCEVIVDPVIDGARDFPGGADVWGRVNTVPYERRGWCCAEFSVALRNGRIVNLSDPLVKAVLAVRAWPHDVENYARMMEKGAPEPVHFTKKGDVAAVLYNFYRMTNRCVLWLVMAHTCGPGWTIDCRSVLAAPDHKRARYRHFCCMAVARPATIVAALCALPLASP